MGPHGCHVRSIACGDVGPAEARRAADVNADAGYVQGGLAVLDTTEAGISLQGMSMPVYASGVRFAWSTSQARQVPNDSLATIREGKLR